MTCRPTYSGALIAVAAIAAIVAPGPLAGTVAFLGLAFGVLVATKFNK